jgi:uncharacterized protein YcfL
MRFQNTNFVVVVSALLLCVLALSVSSVASPTFASADRDVSIAVSDTQSQIQTDSPPTIGSNQDATRFVTLTNNLNEQITVTLTLTNSPEELQEVGFGQLSQNSITVTLSANEQRDISVRTSNQAGNNINGPITYTLDVVTGTGSDITIGEQNGPETQQGSGGGGGGNGNGNGDGTTGNNGNGQTCGGESGPPAGSPACN